MGAWFACSLHREATGIPSIHSLALLYGKNGFLVEWTRNPQATVHEGDLYVPVKPYPGLRMTRDVMGGQSNPSLSGGGRQHNPQPRIGHMEHRAAPTHRIYVGPDLPEKKERLEPVPPSRRERKMRRFKKMIAAGVLH